MDIPVILETIRPDSEWAMSGEAYEDLEWFSDDPKPTLAEIEKAWPGVQAERKWRPIRAKRNALLAVSDWTQTVDAPVDAKAWAVYRQALRDLPASIKDPTAEIKWPEPPK